MEYRTNPIKEQALFLIEDLLKIERIRDADYLRLLAKENTSIVGGESAICFHLKQLRNLVENI